MIRYLIFSLILFTSIQLQGQSKDCTVIIDFFNMYKENCDEALKVLTDSNKDLLITKTVKREYYKTCELKYLKYDFFKTEKIVNSEVHQIYVHYEERGLLFEFGVYFIGEKCKITSFGIVYL